VFETLQNFTESLPPALQWLALIALGAIPFVESYVGSVIGVVAGLSPFVAIPAAIVGNLLSMLVVVLASHRVRSRVTRDREEPEPTPRRQKLRARFDRYGVPGVSLLGHFLLPSQITSVAIISFGAPRNAVILWQSIAIVLWGVVYGTIAAIGVNLVGGR